MSTLTYSIAAVERDTGLSKDVLRVWERRYGFPKPSRDGNGERCYPIVQVERLRLIKRLMDQGHRPGKLIRAPIAQLKNFGPKRMPQREVQLPLSTGEDLSQLLAFIKQHDAGGYQEAMQQLLARHGLQSFVQDIVAILTLLVGEAWERGEIEVFEEHLFSELTKRQLRHVTASLPRTAARRPRVILTTVPDELHELGLLMAEAVFALEGAECIPLGPQMPLLDISRAAKAHQAEIVAVSFSTAFPHRHIPGLLQQLRTMLAHETLLWAGGSGIARLEPLEGIRFLTTLDEGREALARMRA